MRKCLLVLIALLTVVRAGDAFSFDNDMLNSKLAINGNTVPYPIFSIFVMPNKTFTVELKPPTRSQVKLPRSTSL